MYHLFSGERSDAPNSDSDVQHLVSNEIALACALKPGHFYEHCDVPGEKWGEKGEDGGEGREREKKRKESQRIERGRKGGKNGGMDREMDRSKEEGRNRRRDGHERREGGEEKKIYDLRNSRSTHLLN